MTQTDPIHQLQSAVQAVRTNVGRVIVGKTDVIDLLMVALLCEGHVLFEDVPGIGKTTLAKSLAKSLGCSFQRIQFTPDLLPSDITGITYYNQKKGEFEFRPGPLLAQIVLADEINRATPRTQSALLEAMEERQVSVERETLTLPRPFMVIATQNPVELEGTFPLPEAQLDRFLMRLRLNYPTRDEERQILQRFKEQQPLTDLQPVLSADSLQHLQTVIRKIHVEPGVENYIVDLVTATRSHNSIELGVSPRGTLALYRASQAYAAVQGRNYVIPDDVKRVAIPVLSHRMIATSQTRLHGQGMEQIVDEILQRVAVPVES
ncbi:MoxR-like ATPase [Thermosporothrix hazakensis]|jgi:MoxR-like ATPase|uniref:MoxR-like ATPase n=2 Tax=Thermosporothrix TaxID=768650 RepID=A0A326U2M6_THEHA|nr:MoxR family ATPase [Thermosporothrix hazakensis]PZW24681.1 MoxR-like ATPase [Thermosporothrix hazakensis]BBH90337.1 ATPase [Thermosporothrix sp. COM3]GCE48373.1 ATPase [Thermosporothrix hazakensis]